jgi:hypothetical protein
MFPSQLASQVRVGLPKCVQILKIITCFGLLDHPHRGFETVTYMLSGAFVHEDFCGHKVWASRAIADGCEA